MTLRNPERFSQWQFDLETPDGEVFQINGSTKGKVIDQVMRQLAVFDTEKPGFSDKAREEAKSLNWDWYTYLDSVLQQQCCTRIGGVESGLCWSGKGDKISAFMKMLDGKVARSSPIIRKIGRAVTQAATLVATGQSHTTFGGCRSCGGGKTFSGQGKNLGRAGRLNKL